MNPFGCTPLAALGGGARSVHATGIVGSVRLEAIEHDCIALESLDCEALLGAF